MDMLPCFLPNTTSSQLRQCDLLHIRIESNSLRHGTSIGPAMTLTFEQLSRAIMKCLSFDGNIPNVRPFTSRYSCTSLANGGNRYESDAHGWCRHCLAVGLGRAPTCRSSCPRSSLLIYAPGQHNARSRRAPVWPCNLDLSRASCGCPVADVDLLTRGKGFCSSQLVHRR